MIRHIFAQVTFARWATAIGLIGLFAIAGCASGREPANFPMTVGQPASTNPVAPTNPVAATGAGVNTGWLGSVAAPASASFGTSPLSTHFAIAGGPLLVGNGNTATDLPFPAFSSTLQVTSSGLVAAGNDQSASIFEYSQPSNGGEFSYKLVVPALNISMDIQRDPLDFNNVSEPYVYLDAEPVSNGIAYYGYGFETPVSAMPTTGVANFSGFADGYIYSSVGGQIKAGYTVGNAALSVNFASGAITGAFTNMKANLSSVDFTNTTSAWNDVSVSATIAAGTNRFSGATAVTSIPQTPLTLSGNATGHIDGGFYGPAAQNAGAIWSLSDGTTSVLGGVAARH